MKLYFALMAIFLSFKLFASFEYSSKLNGHGEMELDLDFSYKSQKPLSDILNDYLFNKDFQSALNPNYISTIVYDQDTNTLISKIEANKKYNLRVETTGEKFKFKATIVQNCELEIIDNLYLNFECRADTFSPKKKATGSVFYKFENELECKREGTEMKCHSYSRGFMKKISKLFITFKEKDEAAISGLCRNLNDYYYLYKALKNSNLTNKTILTSTNKDSFFKNKIYPVRKYLYQQLDDGELLIPVYISQETVF